MLVQEKHLEKNPKSYNYNNFKNMTPSFKLTNGLPENLLRTFNIKINLTVLNYPHKKREISNAGLMNQFGYIYNQEPIANIAIEDFANVEYYGVIRLG